MRLKSAALGVFLAAASGGPSWAITAGDVLDKMTTEERGGYLSGAIEMVMYLSQKDGNDKKTECLLNWYYHDKESVREIVAVFENYKDKPAMGLLHVVANRHCP